MLRIAPLIPIDGVSFIPSALGLVIGSSVAIGLVACSVLSAQREAPIGNNLILVNQPDGYSDRVRIVISRLESGAV